MASIQIDIYDTYVKKFQINDNFELTELDVSSVTPSVSYGFPEAEKVGISFIYTYNIEKDYTKIFESEIIQSFLIPKYYFSSYLLMFLHEQSVKLISKSFSEEAQKLGVEIPYHAYPKDDMNIVCFDLYDKVLADKLFHG